MKEKLEKLENLLEEIKENEESLKKLVYETTGSSNEYWLAKWSEVKDIREKLEVILDEE